MLVFPAPVGPTSADTCPVSILKLTFFKVGVSGV